jgi:hypothetical protein
LGSRIDRSLRPQVAHASPGVASLPARDDLGLRSDSFRCVACFLELLQGCKEDDKLQSFDLRVQGVVASESSVTGIWEGFLMG